MKHIILILRLISAVVLLQTLYFKFTASPESVYIFTKLGVEPFGRVLSGLAELVTGILLLLPGTFHLLGAFLALNIMFGAIISHFLILGIEIQDDRGLLFSLACLVFLCASLILFFDRKKINLLYINFLKDKIK